MTLLERLAPGPDFRWLALVVIVQMTLVILSAEVAARTVLAHACRAPAALWLCCLICILLGPAVAVLLERARIGLAIVPLTGSLTTPMANVDGTGNRADRMVADDSDLGVPIRSAAGARFDQERSDLLAVESDELASASTASSGRDSDPEPGKEARAAKVMVSEPQPSDDVTFGKLQPFIGSLVLIWAISVAVGVAARSRLAGARSAESVASGLRGLWRRRLSRGAASGLGLARLPAVYTSPLVSGPVAIGIFRPRVVLPERLASALSPRQLRDVLVHEFAHIQSRGYPDRALAAHRRCSVLAASAGSPPERSTCEITQRRSATIMYFVRAIPADIPEHYCNCRRSLARRKHLISGLGSRTRGGRCGIESRAFSIPAGWADQCRAIASGCFGSRSGDDLRCRWGRASDTGRVRSHGTCERDFT